jgi:hypothetical protein
LKLHILFLKNIQLVNVLLSTGKCKNEGNWILSCEDNKEDMKILQKSCTEFLKCTVYKDYKLCFANPINYGDFMMVN